MALPACVLVMVQVPVLCGVTVAPAIVQTAGVSEVKLTARPDEAVAVRFASLPSVCSAG